MQQSWYICVNTDETSVELADEPETNNVMLKCPERQPHFSGVLTTPLRPTMNASLHISRYSIASIL